ncbi:respiratory nitrate reductase subunit gamma [Sulfolobus sp. E5-1-F]|uniref:respiratory nitrate reductase subunit gamma n=1 Tax=Saccharolobus sp. E5-1-F TaxID=2663019 RepID=UPI0012949E70|nr:respiratory nitrate reductase subunit gamma [Sulfolobus sp. E5-1-F]QGA54088.1 respiratory nitrate reductase subunit gamma [Sulfolobus sp. E5-1-F]
MSNLFWIFYPYTTITIFFSGYIYTYFTRRYYWSARSFQLLSKSTHSLASNLFHYGIIVVLLGHLFGIVLPASVLIAVGISYSLHITLAFYLGAVFGIITIIGLIWLLAISYTTRAVNSLSITDHLVYILLALVLITGLINTLVVHPDYENTVAPWFQGLITFHPNPNLMENTPLILQIHIALSFLLYALWPFSRLVHVFTFPITYLWRPYIVYRRHEFYKVFKRN